jgi:hypothetical protein
MEWLGHVEDAEELHWAGFLISSAERAPRRVLHATENIILVPAAASPDDGCSV